MSQFVLPTLLPAADSDCISVLAYKAIRPGMVVIDIGAGDGAWTEAALAGVPGIEVHCFEPDLVKYRQLLVKLSAKISAGQVVPHHATVGRADAADARTAGWATLQRYANHAGLKRLPFVRLGAGVPVTAVLNGCEHLIRRGYIEFILAPATAEQETVLADALLPHRYETFRHPSMNDQVLCVCDRFRSTIKNQPPQTPDVIELCREFGVAARGVIHVGAKDGHESKNYAAAAFAKSLMIEANPANYPQLQQNITGLKGVTAVNCAAGERGGTMEISVSSADHSGSVLLLGGENASTEQKSSITVPAKTIDQIVRETGQSPGDFTLLNLDLKNGGLAAVKGATGVLPNVQAIFTRVNFESHEPGCAMIEEVDGFLESQGFDRAVTHTPFQPGWGNAFYVRRRPAPAPQKLGDEFLYNARNTLVGGWLSIPAASLREAWEGATGHAHRHIVAHGVCDLPLASDDDKRVLQLLEKSLPTAGKDRRLQLLLALMLYVPTDQIAVNLDTLPGWFRKSLAGTPARIAA